MKKYFVVIIHIGIWALLFLYPFVFHYLPLSDYRADLRIFLLMSLVAVFFYSNIYLLIPKFLAKKNFSLYFLLALFSIVLITVAAPAIQYYLNPNYYGSKLGHENTSLWSLALNTGFFAALFAWALSSGIKISGDWFKNERVKAEIEKEKLSAELSLLKSQLNPHFLFNALNNIYSLEQKKSEQTGVAILKLSDIMRYVLYEASDNYVLLEKEIEYLNNYIELQKLSLVEGIKVSLFVTGNVANRKIIPMLPIFLVRSKKRKIPKIISAIPLI